MYYFAKKMVPTQHKPSTPLASSQILHRASLCCVELLGSPYYKGVPFPRIPSIHKLSTKSRIAQRTENATVGRRGTYSHADQSTIKPRRQYSKPDGTAQHASETRIPRNRAVLAADWHPNGICSTTCIQDSNSEKPGSISYRPTPKRNI